MDNARAWQNGVYLSLGSNLGNRRRILESAIRSLGQCDGIRVAAVAAIRETAPAGLIPQPAYLNTAARIETRWPAEALVLLCQSIERRHGRDRLLEAVRWGPRLLDIDVVLYGRRIVHSQVAIIPHPRYRERSFVIEPLLELDPGLADPVTGRPLAAYPVA